MSITPTEEVRAWLHAAVIGLGLCPFAGAPVRAGLVRITGSRAGDAQSLLTDLESELVRLDRAAPSELETTLLVVENLLHEFVEFNDFLDLADGLLRATGREGVYQIASFHPDYQFADSRPDDVANLTNCAPWPVLHILRETSVSRALAAGQDVAAISARNIETVKALTAARRRRIFGK